MTGFFTPQAKFAFPRSYFYEIVVEDQAPTILRVGNNIHTIIDASVGYGIWYIINPKMWAWSSNRYTLDHVVLDCWWEYGFDGVHHPQDYGVAWNGEPLRLKTHILINNPFLTTNFARFPVDPQPSNYWTPSQ